MKRKTKSGIEELRRRDGAPPTRRGFLVGAAAAGALALGRGVARADQQGGDEDVTPVEDLMREHGVLRRVLIVYDECVRRIDAGAADLGLVAVAGGARLVRRFVEDYHEKDEETFVFPRFEKAQVLGDLVATLRKQHAVGRQLTDTILHLAGGSTRAVSDKKALGDALRGFTTMYRAHAAREDTVLFPHFAELVGAKAYQEIGEKFEAEEKRVLGEDGFERMVREVAKLESMIGIGDLAHFTPKA